MSVRRIFSVTKKILRWDENTRQLWYVWKRASHKILMCWSKYWPTIGTNLGLFIFNSKWNTQGYQFPFFSFVDGDILSSAMSYISVKYALTIMDCGVENIHSQFLCFTIRVNVVCRVCFWSLVRQRYGMWVTERCEITLGECGGKVSILFDCKHEAYKYPAKKNYTRWKEYQRQHPDMLW